MEERLPIESNDYLSLGLYSVSYTLNGKEREHYTTKEYKELVDKLNYLLTVNAAKITIKTY